MVADAVAVNVLRVHAVAGTTLQQRHVGMNKWTAVCGARGIGPILRGGPTSFNLDLAEAFIADVVITQGLQGDTARGYLLMLAAAHKALRLPNPVDISKGSGDYALKQAVQAGMNLRPAGGHKRAPFTVDHVCDMLASKQFTAGAMAPTYSALSAASFLGMTRAQAFTSKGVDLFDMFTSTGDSGGREGAAVTGEQDPRLSLHPGWQGQPERARDGVREHWAHDLRGHIHRADAGVDTGRHHERPAVHRPQGRPDHIPTVV